MAVVQIVKLIMMVTLKIFLILQIMVKTFVLENIITDMKVYVHRMEGMIVCRIHKTLGFKKI